MGFRIRKGKKIMETKVVTTHELFQKHFGEVVAVDLKHPKMKAFLSELNEVCMKTF
jgi:hypothetical protein